MAHTFTNLLIHAIFSTKNRRNLLTPDVRERIFPYMGGIIRELKGTALLINGMEDHVHVFTTLPTTISLSDFMKELKGGSSGWANDTLNLPEKFGWQTGYAAFSASRSVADAVRKYVANQQEHHKRMSFQEEYLAFLKRHEIEFDPRFVFDEEFVA